MSLWLRANAEGELTGGLPGNYDRFFSTAGGVILGMRMLGREAMLPAVTVPLAPATASSS